MPDPIRCPKCAPDAPALPPDRGEISGHLVDTHGVASLQERILAGSVPEPNTGCWLWLRGTTEGTNGVLRGKLHVAGRSMLAHRAAYTAFRGPIPDGLQLDHLCRVPLCCNPAHLEAVTGAENQRRGKGSYPTCKRGHPFDEENTAIRTNKRLGKVQRRCRRCEADRVLRAYHGRREIPAVMEGA